MRNDEIAIICTFLQHMNEEEVIKIKGIIKDLCSSPYSDMIIEVCNGQIIRKDFTKKTRYPMKKKENRQMIKLGSEPQYFFADVNVVSEILAENGIPTEHPQH